MEIQAHIPQAAAALHNYIHLHDPDKVEDFEDFEDLQPGNHGEGNLAADQINHDVQE